MSREGPSGPPSLAEEALAQAFSWLLVGNAVGLLMALLLLFPRLGAALGPFTYGRWAAVHIDAQMYGLVLAAAGRAAFPPLPEPPRGAPRLALWSLRAWSAALVFLVLSLLAGHSSGKVFVEWSGAARWVFAAALAFTSLALIAAFFQRLAAWRRGELTERGWSLAAKGLGLLALVPAPVALILAASPGLYLPIDPQSGGATSGNTLASVLGVGVVLAASPFFAGLRPRDGGRFTMLVFALFGLHFLFLARLGPGDHTHTEPLQVVALGSSLIWLPLLWEHWRRFQWPAGSHRWVYAMAGWGLVLAGSGLLAGLPGAAERIKFTNFLVGHVHAAAAGLLTAWLFVLLAALGEKRGLEPRQQRLFADGKAFAAWQAGSILSVAALLLVGWAEGRSPEILWSGAPLVTAGYSLRLAGGLLMATATLRWLKALFGRIHRADEKAENPLEILAADLLPAGRRG